MVDRGKEKLFKFQYAKLLGLRERLDKVSKESIELGERLEKLRKETTDDMRDQIVEIEEMEEKQGQIIKELDDLDREFVKNVSLLTFGPIELFYMVVDSVFFRSIIVWPNKIKDKEEVLAETYSITYKKITEIQLELSKFFESIVIIKFTYSTIETLVKARYSLHGDLRFFVGMYGERGMDSEIQCITDSLVRLNKGMENLKPFWLNMPLH